MNKEELINKIAYLVSVQEFNVRTMSVLSILGSIKESISCRDDAAIQNGLNIIEAHIKTQQKIIDSSKDPDLNIREYLKNSTKAKDEMEAWKYNYFFSG